MTPDGAGPTGRGREEGDGRGVEIPGKDGRTLHAGGGSRPAGAGRGAPAAEEADGNGGLARTLADATLERGPGVPVWRQIETILRAAIAERRFMPGERLPTEQDFAHHFRVHRHTFRRAIAPLVEDGLVDVRQGQGMTVREEVLDYPIRRRTRFSEILSAQHLNPANELLRADEAPADHDVAEALGMPTGEAVIRIEMLRRSDGVPMSVSTDHYPAARFAGLAETVAETGSVTTALARHGVPDYRRLRSGVHARLATREETRLLRQPAHLPVLCVDSLNVDEAGRPVQFTRARFSGARVQIVVEPEG